MEQTRRLVEQDQVFGIFGSVGTPTNASVQRHLNEHKVPQMFLFTGNWRFRDPLHYPWTSSAYYMVAAVVQALKSCAAAALDRRTLGPTSVARG